MHLSRRDVLLAGVATLLAACSTKTGLDEQASQASQESESEEPLGNDRPSAGGNAGGMPSSVAMVGDSITAQAELALEAVFTDMGFGEITINAEPSRRIEVGGKNEPLPGLDVVTFIEANEDPGVWVVAVGTNDAGMYSTDDEYRKLIEDVLDVIPDETPLVWMNTYRWDDLPGCEQFNGLLRSILGDHGNATVGEWYQQCTRSKGEILFDGVHPTSEGILIFADTTRRAIERVTA